MKLEFVRVLFKIGSEILDGVIHKSATANTQRGKFVCTSHCRIKVQDKSYTVLWKLVPVKTDATSNNLKSVTGNQLSKYDCKSDDNDDFDVPDESGQVRTHCLPFKDLGICYSASRQNALKEAYKYIYEYNRDLFCKT